jgi:hypothetical protein
MEARHFMTATKLKDGSVLLAGGYPNRSDQGTAETWIYHPLATERIQRGE